MKINLPFHQILLWSTTSPISIFWTVTKLTDLCSVDKYMNTGRFSAQDKALSCLSAHYHKRNQETRQKFMLPTLLLRLTKVIPMSCIQLVTCKTKTALKWAFTCIGGSDWNNSWASYFSNNKLCILWPQNQSWHCTYLCFPPNNVHIKTFLL